MSEEAGFIAAILEQPAEDTPRLAYADWLQENGRAPRARRIRAEIGLLRYKTPIPEDAMIGGTNGVARLEACPWQSEPWYPDVRCEVERGFINALGCDVMAWLRHADYILATQPIRDVEITGTEMGVETSWPDGPAATQFIPSARITIPRQQLEGLVIRPPGLAPRHVAPTHAVLASPRYLTTAIRLCWPALTFHFPTTWPGFAQPNSVPA
jgi:uncharacterized protein (TIGR02996 family)